jgi:hypothetical protein
MNVRQATFEASKSDGAQEAPRGLEKSTVWYALAPRAERSLFFGQAVP